MFKILTATKCELSSLDKEDKTVSEAINSIYANYSCDDIIIWNNINIRIDRKGDLSSIYDDIIYFISMINSKVELCSHSFLSSTFTVKLEVKRSLENLIITPNFYVVQAFTEEKEFLDMKTLKTSELKLTIGSENFVDQWKNLLESVKRDLIQVGYSSENLEDFHLLEDILT